MSSVAEPGADPGAESGAESGEIAPRRAFAMGLMIFSSVGISFGGLVVRSMQVADAWQINFHRSIAFTAAIALLMVWRYRSATARHVRRIGRPGLIGGALLAAAGIAFMQAMTNTTIANTLFTLSAIPFFTAAFAWLFLREPLSRSTLVTMLAAATGIAVMMADGIGTGSFYGNGMALVTALCFSGYAIIVRKYRSIDMLPTLMVSGVIVIALAALVRWNDLALPLHDLLLCFFLGAVMSGICNALFIIASRHLAAAELTLFMLLEFALGPIWVWIFINEIPTRWTIVGGGAAILAVVLRALSELRRESRETKMGPIAS